MRSPIFTSPVYSMFSKLQDDAIKTIMLILDMDAINLGTIATHFASTVQVAEGMGNSPIHYQSGVLVWDNHNNCIRHWLF